MQRYGCRRCGTPLPAVQAGEALRVRCAQRACGCVNVIPSDPSLAPWESHGSVKLLVIDDPEGAVLLAPPIERRQPYKLLFTLCAVLALLGTLAVPTVRQGIILRLAAHEIRTTKSAGIAQWACESLKSIGPPARSAAPLVWDLHHRAFNRGYVLKESFINDVIRAIDSSFLASQQPRLTRSSSTTELMVALRFPEARIRRTSAGLLGDAGAASREAVGALTAMAQRTQDDARIDAIVALGRIGPSSAPAVPALLKMLSASGTIREAAVRSLEQIAPQDPRVLSAIDLAGIPAPATQRDH